MGFSSDNGIMLSRPKPSGNDSTVQDATRKLNLVPNLGMHVRMRVKRRSEECLPVVQLEMVSATYSYSQPFDNFLSDDAKPDKWLPRQTKPMRGAGQAPTRISSIDIASGWRHLA